MAESRAWAESICWLDLSNLGNLVKDPGLDIGEHVFVALSDELFVQLFSVDLLDVLSFQDSFLFYDVQVVCDGLVHVLIVALHPAEDEVLKTESFLVEHVAVVCCWFVLDWQLERV